MYISPTMMSTNFICIYYNIVITVLKMFGHHINTNII